MEKKSIFGLFSGRAWVALCLAFALAVPAIAQYSSQYGDPSTRVARLNLIQGNVSLQPAGENEWVWASQNRPITTYDGIWTGPGSRAEFHIGSTAIRVGPRTAFSFLNLDDDAVQIELTSGTMNVRVRNMDRNEIYEVDTPNIAFSLMGRGEYRITVDPDDDFTTVTVRSGEGQITGGGQAFLVNAGTQVQVSGRDYITYDAYYVSDRDWFDRWTYARDLRESRSASNRYVSPELTGYEDLDRYGTWRDDPNYGAVWIPTRATRGDWAPYRNGHWAWVEPWGWTWVDEAPFGFVTSHYGRWTSLNTGYGQSVWAWVPPRREQTNQRPAYAPALVTFVSTSREPSYANNVVWVPLAPGEVYVPSYRASTTYVTRVNMSNTAVPQQTITAAVSNPQQSAPSVNQKVAGAAVAMSKTAFVNAQSVASSAVKVETQAVAAAPAAAAPPVTPVKTSVMQASAPAAKAAAPAPKPPAEVEKKSVVAKAAPPPPPVSFEKKQQALAANAGKPLDPKQEQNLRAAAPAPPNAVVTAPPPKEVKPAAELAKKPQPAVSPNEKKQEHATPPAAAAGQQRAEEARQQAAQQQAEKERAQQLAAQERAAKEKAQQEAALAKQQAEQQRLEKERAQQLAAQQQAEKVRAQQQAAQQQAEKQKAQQQAAQAQQQAERARQQAAQQQAEKERAQQQAAQQQAEKERAQQQAAQAQQQAERERQQMAQNRPPTPPEKGRAPEKAPAAQAAGEPLRVPENVQAAKLVSQPELKPPASGARGIVRVRVVIGTDGRIKSAEALTGGPQMRAAALENVRGRVYQPTLMNGKPVEVETEITIRF